MQGAGAHGYFEVTADVSKYTKAKCVAPPLCLVPSGISFARVAVLRRYLNKVGKRTPVFVRFSTVGGEKGERYAQALSSRRLAVSRTLLCLLDCRQL